MSASQIAAAAQELESAPLLFSEGDLGPVKELERSPKGYTAERLFRERPEDYRAIVAALAANESRRSLCGEFRVGAHTLQAIAEREGLQVASLKKSIAGNLLAFAQHGSERMMEEAESMDLDKLPIGVAVAIDKAAQLLGEAQMIVEHRHVVGVDDFGKALQMGLESAKKAQTEAIEAQVVDAPKTAERPLKTDYQSDDILAQSLVFQGTERDISYSYPSLSTVPASVPSSTPGGGGDPAAAAPSNHEGLSAPENFAQ